MLTRGQSLYLVVLTTILALGLCWPVPRATSQQFLGVGLQPGWVKIGGRTIDVSQVVFTECTKTSDHGVAVSITFRNGSTVSIKQEDGDRWASLFQAIAATREQFVEIHELSQRR